MKKWFRLSGDKGRMRESNHEIIEKYLRERSWRLIEEAAKAG